MTLREWLRERWRDLRPTPDVSYGWMRERERHESTRGIDGPTWTWPVPPTEPEDGTDGRSR